MRIEISTNFRVWKIVWNRTDSAKFPRQKISWNLDNLRSASMVFPSDWGYEYKSEKRLLFMICNVLASKFFYVQNLPWTKKAIEIYFYFLKRQSKRNVKAIVFCNFDRVGLYCFQSIKSSAFEKFNLTDSTYIVGKNT